MPRPALPLKRPLAWALALAGGVTLVRALTSAVGRPKAAASAQPPPEPAGYGIAHETRDMNGRLMIALTAGLGVTIAFVIAAMVVLTGRLLHADRAARPAYTAQQLAPTPPPAPNLQADPMRDIAAFDRAQAAQLSAYAWGGDRRTARIPIDRAKALLLGRPLDPPP